jgi:hypothetical protein
MPEVKFRIRFLIYREKLAFASFVTRGRPFVTLKIGLRVTP